MSQTTQASVRLRLSPREREVRADMTSLLDEIPVGMPVRFEGPDLVLDAVVWGGRAPAWMRHLSAFVVVLTLVAIGGAAVSAAVGAAVVVWLAIAATSALMSAGFLAAVTRAGEGRGVRLTASMLKVAESHIALREIRRVSVRVPDGGGRTALVARTIDGASRWGIDGIDDAQAKWLEAVFTAATDNARRGVGWSADVPDSLQDLATRP